MLPLSVRDVHLTLGGTGLIHGISMTVDHPGVTVLMGPNGAGKSLLLRILHGLILPTSGRVTWAGSAPDEFVRQRQAMVFQRPVLLRRSVRANMEFVLQQRHRAVDRAHCEDLLARVGLLDYQARPARRLSGGEQQRLALARALALEPEVLLMDEPSASLDPASTATIESVVAEMKTSGTKVIYVTHDVAQARRLADEVIFLHRGNLLEHTPAAQFFNQPHCAEARQYLAGDIVL